MDWYIDMTGIKVGSRTDRRIPDCWDPPDTVLVV